MLGWFNCKAKLKKVLQSREHCFKNIVFHQNDHWEGAESSQHVEVLVDVYVNFLKVINFNIFHANFRLAIFCLGDSLFDSDESFEIISNYFNDHIHFSYILISYIFLNIEINGVHEVDQRALQWVAEVSHSKVLNEVIDGEFVGGYTFSYRVLTFTTVAEQFHILNSIAQFWRNLNLSQEPFILHEFLVSILHLEDVKMKIIESLLTYKQMVHVLPNL